LIGGGDFDFLYFFQLIAVNFSQTRIHSVGQNNYRFAAIAFLGQFSERKIECFIKLGFSAPVGGIYRIGD
jgi:hypothetical protein